MTVNAGVIVSVPGNELLQFGCRLGEVFNVEGHILNQTGCSRRTGSSYRGKCPNGLPNIWNIPRDGR